MAALLALALGSGCNSPRKVASKKFTFFPPAPDEPRIQFLTAFSSDLDLGGKTTFLDFVTGKPPAPTPLVKPYGLALRDGKLYVCDTMSACVAVIDLVKKRGTQFAPRGEGRIAVPINITFDNDGTLYIADSGRNQVLIYGKDGVFAGAIGTQDEMKPTDVAVTADRLYVSDVKGHGVRVYSKTDRKLLYKIPADEKAESGRLFSPTNLAIDEKGRLLVSDTGAFSIQVYDLDGKYIRRIGQQGVAPGLFARPKGVSVDRQGTIYVVDASTQVVQLFDPEGKLLMFFGQPGASTEGELYLPASVKVDYNNVKLFQDKVAPGFDIDHLILVSSQFGDNKVSIYAFLRKK